MLILYVKGEEFSSLKTKNRGIIMTDSLTLARKFKRRHFNLTKVIKQYREDFEGFGELKVERVIHGRGRPFLNYLLNEQQVSFLLMLLDNTEEVLAFKEKFIMNYMEVRKEYLEKIEEV